MKLRRRRETPDQEYERLQREQGQREQRANEDRAARSAGSGARPRARAGGLRGSLAARRPRRCASRAWWRSPRSPWWSAPRRSPRSPRATGACSTGRASTGCPARGRLCGRCRSTFHRRRRAGPVRGPGRPVDAAAAHRRVGRDPGRAGRVRGRERRPRPGALLSDRATAAVPPLAAFAALGVGLGVLKRVVGQHAQPPLPSARDGIPADVVEAAKASMRATIAAGNPWSVNGLQNQFSLTRAQATEVRQTVLSETNGHQATT